MGFRIEVIGKLGVGTAGGWLERMVRPVSVQQDSARRFHRPHINDHRARHLRVARQTALGKT